jgi:hypothetical protein
VGRGERTRCNDVGHALLNARLANDLGWQHSVSCIDGVKLCVDLEVGHTTCMYE